MVIDPGEHAAAQRYLSADIDVVEAPLNDAWMRDMGPTFVHADDGSVAAVDWVFNGWGAQDWAQWDRDEKIGVFVAGRAATPVVSSALVNEGGGIQVDGEGTALATETVQLDPGRNPGLNRADVEAELARTIGSTHVVWLPRGLARDSEQYGTRGHVDIVATFTAPGRVLVHDQRDPAHPDHAVSRTVVDLLERSVDATGRRLEVTRLPAPTVLADAGGPVDYSYVNHFVVNGAVVSCSFDDPVDDEALEILAAAYPGRAVVPVDARPLFARGGGVHCITQQQPASRPGGAP